MISTTGEPNQRSAAGCTSFAIHCSSADTIGQASVAAGLIDTGPIEPVTGAPRADRAPAAAPRARRRRATGGGSRMGRAPPRGGGSGSARTEPRALAVGGSARAASMTRRRS